MAEIVLNPMSEEKEEKFRKALQAVADSMGIEVECETLSVIKVSWKQNPNLGEVIKIISGNQVAKVQTHGNRYTVVKGTEDPKNS